MVSMISPPVRHGQPTNLLDNSDFAIAQAGYGGMHGATRYVADRWANTYGFGTFKAANPGVTMTYATNHAYANQRISYSTRLVGKVLTFAVMTDEFGLLLCTGRYTATNAVDARYFNDRCEIVIVDGSARIVVVEGVLTVRWAALYEGAYTTDTLPPYMPKSCTMELAECQKHFYMLQMGAGAIPGYYSSGTMARVMINLPERMRINPTITVNAALGSILPGNTVPTSGPYSAYRAGNMLVCNIDVTGGAGGTFMYWKPNSPISFSADL